MGRKEAEKTSKQLVDLKYSKFIERKEVTSFQLFTRTNLSTHSKTRFAFLVARAISLPNSLEGKLYSILCPLCILLLMLENQNLE